MSLCGLPGHCNPYRGQYHKSRCIIMGITIGKYIYITINAIAISAENSNS